MSSLWWGQSAFDDLVEKATSELLPAGQVDLALHLDISDQIRSKKVNVKEALRALKKRLNNKNPNVVIATLSLVDTCIKNSGSTFVKEVASREFMEELTRLVKLPTGHNQDVKEKVLCLIQVWAIASKGNNSLHNIAGTYNILRAEGYEFPQVSEQIDSQLLETAVAPDWTDSDTCERCRTSFTFTNRKHHCRQCGHTFCQQCSSKNLPLPHLGINNSVRVCDGCYIKVKLAKVAERDAVPHLLGTSNSPFPTLGNQTKHVAENEQFEDDIKKAIELSLKESQQQMNLKEFMSNSAPAPKQKTKEEEEEEANIAAAIAASLEDVKLSGAKATTYTPTIQKNELSTIDKENIELFSKLMDQMKSAGSNATGDPELSRLYEQIGTLQPKLIKELDKSNQQHALFVNLHNKLNNVIRLYDKLSEDRYSQRSNSISYPAYQQPTAMGNTPYYNSQPQQFPTAQVMPQTPVQQYYQTPLVQSTPAIQPLQTPILQSTPVFYPTQPSTQQHQPPMQPAIQQLYSTNQYPHYYQPQTNNLSMYAALQPQQYNACDKKAPEAPLIEL